VVWLYQPHKNRSHNKNYILLIFVRRMYLPFLLVIIIIITLHLVAAGNNGCGCPRATPPFNGSCLTLFTACSGIQVAEGFGAQEYYDKKCVKTVGFGFTTKLLNPLPATFDAQSAGEVIFEVLAYNYLSQLEESLSGFSTLADLGSSTAAAILIVYWNCPKCVLKSPNFRSAWNKYSRHDMNGSIGDSHRDKVLSALLDSRAGKKAIKVASCVAKNETCNISQYVEYSCSNEMKTCPKKHHQGMYPIGLKDVQCVNSKRTGTDSPTYCGGKYTICGKVCYNPKSQYCCPNTNNGTDVICGDPNPDCCP